MLLGYLFLALPFWVPEKDTLSPVIVSAQRMPIQVHQTTLAVQSMAVQAAATYQSPELLMQSPGVFVQRTNLGGGSPIVRGLTGNQTLLVLDGLRFNNSTFRSGPNQYLNTINPLSIGNVEVLRGGGAVSFGSDALSGAIHLISNKPKFSFRPEWIGQLSTRWISQGMEFSTLGRLEYRRSKSALSLGFSRRHFGDVVRGGDGFKQSPSGYDENHLGMHFLQQWGPRWRFEFQSMLTEQQNVPVYHKVQLEQFEFNQMDKQRYQRHLGRWTYLGKSKFLSQVEFTAAYQSSLEKRSMKKRGASTVRREGDEVETLALVLHQQIPWSSAWKSSQGLEFYQDFIQSQRVDQGLQSSQNMRGLFPNHSQYQSFAFFSMHHLDWKQWQAEFGLRFQTQAAFIPDPNLGKVRLSAGAWVHHLGWSRALGQRTWVYLSHASGFRAPNMDDYASLGIVDFRYELPAYDLKPERSNTINLGLRQYSSHWKAEINGFYTRLNDLIQRVKTNEILQNYPVFIKTNVDAAELYGMEFSQSWQMGEHWRMQQAISYTHGQNLGQQEPMRRIPPLFGHLNFSYKKNQWQFGLQSLFAAKQYRLSANDRLDNRMDPQGTPAWMIWNASASRRLTKHWELSAQWMNIGNLRYRMHGSGMDGMGRSMHLQLTWRF